MFCLFRSEATLLVEDDDVDFDYRKRKALGRDDTRRRRRR